MPSQRRRPFAWMLSLLGACASPAKPTLYQRLGGEVGIAQVVSRALDRSACDARTPSSFEASLAQQVCALSGGPCVYEGETMARSHKAAKITASEFDALVSMLRQELDAAGVTASAKNELLRQLAPMKRDIVANH